MRLTTSRVLFSLFLLLTAFLGGCGGSDVPGPGAGGGNIVTVTNDQFTLQPNVKVLSDDASVTVESVEDDRVTLGGNVPPLEPGDVIIQNNGDERFLRRVVRVEAGGVVVTERAGLTDVFEEAHFELSEAVGPDALRQLQPAVPGVTFGEPVQRRREVQGRGTVLDWYLPVNFDKVLVSDATRGSVEVNGGIEIAITMDSALDISRGPFNIPTGIDRFKVVPGAIVSGNLSIEGDVSGRFEKQIDLTNTINIPLAGWGPIGLNGTGKLALTLDGYVQADGRLQMDGGVDMQAGVQYRAGNWSTVRVFEPFFNVIAPEARVNANLGISMIAPRFGVNVLGCGDVWVQADMLRAEVNFRAVSSPEPGFEIKTSRAFGFTAGADIVLSVARINLIDFHRQFPRFSLPKVPINEVFIPQFPPDPEPIALILSPGAPSLRSGEYSQLSALALNEDSSLKPAVVEWSVDDNRLLRLTPAGTDAYLLGLAEGRTWVHARHSSGLTADVLVEILPARLVSLEVSPSSSSMPERYVQQFRAIGVYGDGTRRDLTYYVDWSLSNANGSITQGGYFEAIREGIVDIEIREPYTGLTASAPVTITPPSVLALWLAPYDPPTLTLPKGTSSRVLAVGFLSDGSYRYVNSRVAWHSYDPDVVAIDQLGLATGVERGSAWVTAYETENLTGAYNFKLVQVGPAPMTALVIEPADLGSLPVGDQRQLRAIAILADGARVDVTNKAQWFSLFSEVAQVDRRGFMFTTGPGQASITAIYSQFGDIARFRVRGPVKLSFSGQPPNGQVGQPFSVTVDVLDELGARTSSDAEIRLELRNNAGQAVPMNGTLIRRAVNGRATFDGLSSDTAGNGMRIVAFGSGLTRAESRRFRLAAQPATPPTRLITNSRGQGGHGLVVLGLDPATGAPSVFNTAATTAVGSVTEKVGSFVYMAIGAPGPAVNSVDAYSYNPANGELTFIENTGANSVGTTQGQPLFLESNGSSTLFVLSLFDSELRALRINADGSLTTVDLQNVATDTGNGSVNLNDLAFYDVPNSDTDFLYLNNSLVAGQASFPLYSFDALTQQLTYVGNPSAQSGGAGQDIMIYDGHLYGAFDISGNNVNIYRIGAAGTLSFVSTTSMPAGNNSPLRLLAVEHPQQGPMLYVTVQFPNPAVAIFRIPANLTPGQPNPGPQLQFLGSAPVGEINPHSLIDVSLTPTQQALYVATSNRVAAFLIDPVTATLEAVTGSPFLFPELASPDSLNK